MWTHYREVGTVFLFLINFINPESNAEYQNITFENIYINLEDICQKYLNNYYYNLY